MTRQKKRNELWFLYIAEMMLKEMGDTCWFRSCPDEWLVDQVETMLKRKGKTAERDEIMEAIQNAAERQEIRAEVAAQQERRAPQLALGLSV